VAVAFGGGGVQLVERDGLGLDLGSVGEVSEGWPSPQGEGVVE